MSKSSRRHGTVALGAAAAALLAVPVAQAAPPVVYHASGSPTNPRTTTPVTFFSYGDDPEDTKVQFAWDFGTGTFGALQDDTKAGHTFSTDGVHSIAVRLQDAAGEKTDKRFPFATHPDNWKPLKPDFYEQNFQNLVTQNAQEPAGQRLRVYYLVDDSPESGWSLQWDLNNDGTFNGTGDGDAVEHEPEARQAHFTSDGPHPIKLRLIDGQGLESDVVSASVRTHTANEGPWTQSAYDREIEIGDVQAGQGRMHMYWSDDYSDASQLSLVGWKLDGAAQEGGTVDWVDLPASTGLGEHTVEVKVSDAGHQAGEPDDAPTGEPMVTTKTFKVTVVPDVTYPAELGAHSSLEGHHDNATPTFRTLENISLHAWEGSGKEATSYSWDLDNDGQFDDSTGYGTYFSAPNKGTYKVAARMEIKDGVPITVDRTIVIDKGQDYAPKTDTNTNTNTNTNTPTTGGGIDPKVAMTNLLTSETLEFLQAVGGANKKGINAAKPVVSLGKLGADQLPNGGTGQFNVFDKPAGKKLVARAAAAKRKLLGATKVVLAKGQSKKVLVKLNKKGKALLKKKGKVKLTVDATLTDALTGAQVSQSKSYTFKVKKAKKKRK